ncbi:MAG: TIGR00730 family Rossman fold protein [Planctomycetota bacterium]
MRRICVFCGSNFGKNPVYREVAEELGRRMARRGVAIVYGGGNVGLMGALANAALGAGGEVIGVVPRMLSEREVAHHGVTELKVVETMHERKALMVELSDAFLSLPGGIGTMDEFFETLTWAQLDIHRKPCGILNLNGYYDHLVRQLDRFVEDGFLSPSNRRLIIIREDIDQVMYALDHHKPTAGEMFFERDGSRHTVEKRVS